MDEAESAGDGRDEYYGYSPLQIFSDSYFAHPVQYGGNVQNDAGAFTHQVPHLGVGINPNPNIPNYPIAAQQIHAESHYPPFQLQNPMDLGLLSAENYREGPYTQQAPAHSDQGVQLYGGLVPQSPQQAAPPVPLGRMRSKRSSKKEGGRITSADDGSGRQRGRPRLDTRDQTAAERRRTQIRLAQRAYRQRKETTISGLKLRVKSLEKSVEDMNKAFVEFNETAIQRGIRRGDPTLAERLEVTAELFAELSKSHRQESDHDEEDVNPLSAQRYEVEEAEHSNRSQTSTASQPEPAVVLGYQATIGEESDDDDEEDDDDGETTQSIPIPQVILDIALPPLDWTTTEAMQHHPIEKMPTSVGGSVDDNGRQCHFGALETVYAIQKASGPVRENKVGIPGVGVSLDLVPRNAQAVPESDKTGYLGSWSKSLLDITNLPYPLDYSHTETYFAR